MPQVIAWKCPRTGVLIEAKAAYIAHLYRMGTESTIRRPVERSFNALKKSAEGAADVIRWLVQHGRECIQMENDLQSVEENPAARRRNLPQIDAPATVTGAKLLKEAASVRFREYRVDLALTMPKKNSDHLAECLKRLGGVEVVNVTPSNSRGVVDFALVFEPEQWVFSAKSMLYANMCLRSKGQLPGFVAEQEGRIDALLEMHFPSLTKKALIEYLPLIELMGDAASFAAWIDQYREGNLADTSVQLPPMETSMSSTRT